MPKHYEMESYQIKSSTPESYNFAQVFIDENWSSIMNNPTSAKDSFVEYVYA